MKQPKDRSSSVRTRPDQDPSDQASLANAKKAEPSSGEERSTPALRGLVVSNMWPQPNAPAFGVFVAQQVADVRRAGLELDLFLVEGWKSRWNYFSSIWRLRQHLRQQSYDFVHAHYVLSGLVALLAGVKPLIVTHHGIEVFEGWQAPLAKWVTKRADRCLVISPAMAQHLGLPMTQVLPCGIDLARFQPGDRMRARQSLGLSDDPEKKLVAWVGADRPEKRLGLAKQCIEALNSRLLAQERVNQGMAVELHQVSGIPPDEVPLHIQACDALLVSSTREGGPLVVKEALAIGRPVVSTDVGDVAGLLEGLPGCSVRDEHPEALAEGLLEAINTGPIDASDRMQAFDRKRIAARLLEHYLALIAASRERNFPNHEDAASS